MLKINLPLKGFIIALNMPLDAQTQKLFGLISRDKLPPLTNKKENKLLLLALKLRDPIRC